jgi:DNA-binding transcriptional ArsR family regulator
MEPHAGTPAGAAGTLGRGLLHPGTLAALASPRRQEILRLTWDRELSAGAIHAAMPDVTFGAVSLQLRVLVEAGLLESRAEHRYRYYRARPLAVGPVRTALEQMWSGALWRLKLSAELEQRRRGPRPRTKKRRRR